MFVFLLKEQKKTLQSKATINEKPTPTTKENYEQNMKRLKTLNTKS
jgi:hypothetical protein